MSENTDVMQQVVCEEEFVVVVGLLNPNVMPQKGVVVDPDEIVARNTVERSPNKILSGGHESIVLHP